MMEEELIKIWQSSPNQERIKFEKSRLMIDMQSSLDTLHRRIKYRDLMEKIAIVGVSPVFAYYAYQTPYALTKVASVLVILWGIFVIFRLQNAKKHKPSSFTETYLKYLYKSREYLEIQRQMLDNILYWYILPAIAILLLFISGFIGVPGKSKYIIRTGIFAVVTGIAIYFLNKRAVKLEITPRLQKIDELIKVMEQS